MSAIILGAGLSGLIAATQFPNATVFEANGPEHLSHKAVLRFRSDSLSRLTGIPFRKVTVRKSIWHEGKHVAPNIQLANLYSFKTNGGYLDRSIWKLDPVEARASSGIEPSARRFSGRCRAPLSVRCQCR